MPQTLKQKRKGALERMQRTAIRPVDVDRRVKQFPRSAEQRATEIETLKRLVSH